MATIRYDRDTLISIGLQSTYQLTPDPCWPTEIQRDPSKRHRKKAHRGKRAGVKNWLRTLPPCAPLPTILLTNIQSLQNSLLQDLQAREKFQKDIEKCNLLCFTETRLSPAVPDHEIRPNEFFSVYRLDATTEQREQVCGGGLCLLVSRKWCDSDNIVPLTRFFSHNLELLSIRCRPLCLLQDYTSVIVSAVFVPPHADADAALFELHRALTQQQVQHPGAALILAGDLNGVSLKRIMPGLYQHVSCPAKNQRCYTPFRDAYRSQPYRPYGETVDAATFLIPTYTQQEAPIHSEVTPCLGRPVFVLQNAVYTAHWEMFKNLADYFFKGLNC